LTHPKPATIVIIGGNTSFNYLIQRYGDWSGYSIVVSPTPALAETICRSKPVAVIFPSVENLEDSQSLVAELTNCDIPIIVCSSTADQNRTRELGADYCLLHPLGYDNFSATLAIAITSHNINEVDGRGAQ